MCLTKYLYLFVLSTMADYSACREDAFGPSVQGCLLFDFTLLFEDTILSLLPSCCFLVIGLGRCWFLSGKSICVVGGYQRWLKLVSKIHPTFRTAEEITTDRALCSYTARCNSQLSSLSHWSRAFATHHLWRRSLYQRSAPFCSVSFRSLNTQKAYDHRQS